MADLQQAQQSIQTLQDEVNQLKATAVALNAALTATQNATAGAKPPPMPNIKFYDAGDDWYSFRRTFESMCDYQGYTDEKGKVALAFCMRDSASKVTEDIKPGDHTTIKEMIEAYEKRFVPAAASALAQTKFEQAAQQHKETLREWHGRIRALYLRAYPTGKKDDVQLIRRFSQGIYRSNIRMQTMRDRPQTYADALDTAQNEQSVLDAQDPKIGTDAGYIKPRTTIKDMGEPMEIGAIQAMGACYNCGQSGHISRSCPKPSKTPYRSTSRGRGGSKGRNPTTTGRGRTGAARRFNRYTNFRNRYQKRISEITDELGELAQSIDQMELFGDEEEDEYLLELAEAYEEEQKEESSLSEETDHQDLKEAKGSEETDALCAKGDFP
jgi:hypothetical protein